MASTEPIQTSLPPSASTHTAIPGRPADAAGALARRLGAYQGELYQRGFVEGRTGRRTELWPVGIQEAAGAFLRDVVTREGARSGLETGLGLGLSTTFIVQGLLASGPGASHTVVEPSVEYYDRAGERTVQESGAGEVTTIIHDDSTLALPRLVSQGRQFDVAYIDGCHLFEFPFIDIFYALRLVRPGGLIIVDDHWMRSVQTALGFFCGNRGVKLELYDPMGAGKRFVGLRVPLSPDARAWDHFVDFSAESLPEYPWRRGTAGASGAGSA